MFFDDLGKKGGALASAIHSHMQHGDPYIRDVIKHTLALVAQPIFSTVTRWIYDGELEDNFHEVRSHAASMIACVIVP